LRLSCGHGAPKVYGHFLASRNAIAGDEERRDAVPQGSSFGTAGVLGLQKPHLSRVAYPSLGAVWRTGPGITSIGITSFFLHPDQKLSLSANWIWRMALEVEVM
jgi:hypothetical protein